MSISVLTLGHGGGVPFDNDAGNTNYALFSDLDCFESAFLDTKPTMLSLLRTHPYVLVDCGYETLQLLLQAGSDALRNCKAIIITHAHSDHTGGLASLCWRLKFVEKITIPLWTTPDVRCFLDSQLIELEFMGDGTVHHWTHVLPVNLTQHNQHKNLSESPSENLMWILFDVDHNIEGFPASGVSVFDSSLCQVTISGDTAFPVEDASDLVYHDVQFYAPELKPNVVHCPYPLLKSTFTEERCARTLLAHSMPSPQYLEGFFGHAQKGSLTTTRLARPVYNVESKQVIIPVR